MFKRLTSKIKIPKNIEKTDIKKPQKASIQVEELNGPKGPEPTRYGDWERKGRVYDF